MAVIGGHVGTKKGPQLGPRKNLDGGKPERKYTVFIYWVAMLAPC